MVINGLICLIHGYCYSYYTGSLSIFQWTRISRCSAKRQDVDPCFKLLQTCAQLLQKGFMLNPLVDWLVVRFSCLGATTFCHWLSNQDYFIWPNGKMENLELYGIPSVELLCGFSLRMILSMQTICDKRPQLCNPCLLWHHVKNDQKYCTSPTYTSYPTHGMWWLGLLLALKSVPLSCSKPLSAKWPHVRKLGGTFGAGCRG